MSKYATISDAAIESFRTAAGSAGDILGAAIAARALDENCDDFALDAVESAQVDALDADVARRRVAGMVTHRFVVGDRVFVEAGHDSEWGRVTELVDDATVMVAWDSGVTTPADPADLTDEEPEDSSGDDDDAPCDWAFFDADGHYLERAPHLHRLHGDEDAARERAQTLANLHQHAVGFDRADADLEHDAEYVEPEELDELADRADWDRRNKKAIASFVSCCYGAQGVEPGDVNVYIESADVDGLTIYRVYWADDGSYGDIDGTHVFLDRDVAVAAGEEYASGQDEALAGEDAEAMEARLTEEAKGRASADGTYCVLWIDPDGGAPEVGDRFDDRVDAERVIEAWYDALRTSTPNALVHLMCHPVLGDAESGEEAV